MASINLCVGYVHVLVGAESDFGMSLDFRPVHRYC